MPAHNPPTQANVNSNRLHHNHRQMTTLSRHLRILPNYIERGYDLDLKNPTKQEEAHEYSSTELMQMLESSFSKSNSLLNQLKEAMQ